MVAVLASCSGQIKENSIDDAAKIEAFKKQAENKERFNRALVFQQNGDNSRAVVIYKSLLAEDENLISPLVNLGVIAFENNEYDLAKQYFEKVISSTPNDKVSLGYLAYIFRDSGAFDKAEEYYRKILLLDPENAKAIRNLGILLDLYRGRLDEALALYEQYQGLQTEPDPKVKDWIFDTKNRLKVK